jgi:hypothetical protein
MRFRHAAFICATALISQFALAAPPQTAHGAPLASHSHPEKIPTPIVQEMGVVEAVVEFCSKVEPKDKEQLERKARELLPKMSEDAREAARHTSEYHTAFGLVQSILQGLSKPDAERNCLAVR